jgi:hypothetical protein
MKRRSLDFRDADAVIAEIHRLREGGYAMLGKWNLSQMCEHIRETLRIGLDGKRKRMPWVLRTLIARPMVSRALKTRRMASGIPAPKEIVPTVPGGPDDPAVIESCIATLIEARDTDGPLPPHPMCDMTVDEWKQLNWVHAAHHLGFLVPKEQPVPEAPAGTEAASSGPP